MNHGDFAMAVVSDGTLPWMGAHPILAVTHLVVVYVNEF